MNSVSPLRTRTANHCAGESARLFPMENSTMKTLKTTLAAALLGCTALVGQAQAKAADPLMGCTLPGIYCVYDSHNHPVGTATGSIFGLTSITAATLQPAPILIRPINGQVYALEYSDEGLSVDAVFYYNDRQCSTTPYLQTGWIDGGQLPQFLPMRAAFDGQMIWGPVGPITGLIMSSFSYGGYCVGSTGFINARPAAVIDSTVFYPPFKVQ